MLTHEFYLTGIYMRHGKFYGYRQIDNHLVIRGGLPNVQNAVTDVQRKFHFCPGKTFGRVFELKIPFGFCCNFLQQFSAKNSDINDFFFGFAKYLFSLRH